MVACRTGVIFCICYKMLEFRQLEYRLSKRILQYMVTVQTHGQTHVQVGQRLRTKPTKERCKLRDWEQGLVLGLVGLFGSHGFSRVLSLICQRFRKSNKTLETRVTLFFIQKCSAALFICELIADRPRTD